MANIYTGDIFQHIDEDAYGTGATGSDTFPLDMWLVTQQYANALYLRKRKRRFNYSFPNNVEDDYGYGATGDGGVFHLFAVPLEPGDKTVTASVMGKAVGEEQGEERSSPYLRLWHIGGEVSDPKIMGGSSLIGSLRSTVDVRVDYPQIGLFAIKVSTKHGSAYDLLLGGETCSKLSNVALAVDNLNASSLDKLAGGLQSLPTHASYQLVFGSESDAKTRVNLLHISGYNPRSGTLDASRTLASIYPDPSPAGTDNLERVQVEAVDGVTSVGITIEIEKDPNIVSRGWVNKSAGAMSPNEPVVGDDEITLQRSLQALYESPYPHTMGPNGVVLPGTNSQQYHPRWSKVYADARGLLDDQLIMPVAATGTTTLTWYGLVVCAHIIENNQEAWINPDVWLDNLGDAPWTFNVSVQRLEDGDEWGDNVIASAESVHTLPMFIADHQAQFPILNQLYWSYFDDGPGGTNWKKTNLEGLLFSNDFLATGGRGPVVPISASIEFVNTEQYYPVRVKVEAETGPGEPVYAGGGVGTDDEQVKSRIVLACVSSTLVEEPVFGG